MRILMIGVAFAVAACSDNGKPSANTEQNNAAVASQRRSPAPPVAVSASAATAGVRDSVRTLGTAPSAQAQPASSPAGVSAAASGYHLGVASLGMSFTELLSHIDHDSTEEQDGYLLVMKNGETLFGLSDKNWLHSRVVWMISIGSPRVTTDGGVHVGMSVKELLQKFPDAKLALDEDDAEVFAPAELWKGTPENPDAGILIFVGGKNGGSLEHGPAGSDGKIQEFSTDGSVTHILVLVGGNR